MAFLYTVQLSLFSETNYWIALLHGHALKPWPRRSATSQRGVSHELGCCDDCRAACNGVSIPSALSSNAWRHNLPRRASVRNRDGISCRRRRLLFSRRSTHELTPTQTKY